jgi:uncharacterized protein
MIQLSEERSLKERLQARIAVEEQFAATGRKYRNKPFLLKHERYWLRPLIKYGLKAVGLYRRGVQNALTPVVKRLRLEYPDLPEAFDGFEILHLSDLHIDGVDGLPEALSPVLKSLRPDVCLITGDYRFEDFGPCENVYPRMRKVLRDITARYGTYAILGNHDVAEIALELECMGVHMLINEAVAIERGEESLWLAGIDDPFDYRTDDLPGTLDQIPEGGFTVLLAHTPELYRQAAEWGVNLYLCGHTHAGQIRFPLIGSIRHNADCPKKYSFGYWKHEMMNGYTSAGVGCSALPIRFNCPPELVVIELRKAA